MHVGRRDRRIQVQGKTVAHNDAGEEVESWTTLATVWAEKKENGGNERFTAAQFVGKQVTTFRFSWHNAVKVVTVEHRIVFDGREFDIEAVREIGRREGIEVDCSARSENPVTNG